MAQPGASAERISSVVRSNATTGWISVNERLPECGKKVLATYKNEYGKDRTICAMYAERHKIESTSNEDCDDEYSEELDNYFIKEGWYEVIENWPDYSSVVVHEGVVTHWMPLPDAPEV